MAVEPALAEEWLTVQSQPDAALRAAAAAIPPAALRPEFDAGTVSLILWTLAGSGVQDLLVERADRTPAEEAGDLSGGAPAERAVDGLERSEPDLQSGQQIARYRLGVHQLTLTVR